MNFQTAEKTRFENPLPRRRIRLKGMGRVQEPIRLLSSVICDIKAGLQLL